MLDLRRLSVFWEVAERGSFSAAALSLDYTQSVVSHHVAELERELGVTLVERSKRPVRLTPAGERLREHAGALLGAARAAEADMRALAGMETGELRIGAFLSACATFVPPAIGAFAAGHPGLDVRLDQQDPPTALPRLIAGELDIAIVWRFFGETAPLDPRLEQVHLIDDPYRIVLHPSHRLARRSSARLAQLAGERFAGPRPVHGAERYHEMLERLCGEAGFTPDVAYLVDDVTVARTFVAAGLCVALMPELSLPHPRPDVAVKPVPDIDPFRSISAVWMRGRRVPGIAPMVAALEAAAGSIVRHR